MKIAIIADTHDNLTTLKKAIDWFNENNIEAIIHCGDVCAFSTLNDLADNFSEKIHLVFGNIDGDQYQVGERKASGAIKNVVLYGDLGEIELDDKKIAFTHKPYFAKALAQTGKYDLVFYGHTHKPWEEVIVKNEAGDKIKKCRLVNPGTLAGMFYKATFAVYDTESDKLDLKILERLFYKGSIKRVASSIGPALLPR